MNGEKRKALLKELIDLAEGRRFFVSMETDSKFFRGEASATPEVRIGVLLTEDSTRPTVTAGPLLSDRGLPDYGSVVFRALTNDEKEEICTILSGIASRAGVSFKLLKGMTNVLDGLLWYRFR